MDRINDARSSIKEAIDIRKAMKEGWNKEIADELDNLIRSLEQESERIAIPKDYHATASMTCERAALRRYR